MYKDDIDDNTKVCSKFTMGNEWQEIITGGINTGNRAM
jgi:hypothetical protein